MNMDAFENEKGKEKRSAWRDAEAYGIDMSLLEINLRKTPEEGNQQLVSVAIHGQQTSGRENP